MKFAPIKRCCAWLPAAVAVLSHAVTGCGGPDADGSSASYSDASAVSPQRPFPQHVTYVQGTSKPNHVTQTQLDSSVRSFYDAWKNKYVTKLGLNQYYIHATTWQPDAVSVSEGHGYGMMVTALMAGHDQQARQIYDGMYRFFRAHPAYNTQLMAWYQRQQGGTVVTGERWNATDGDLDIAQSLLLADKQWGSGTTINYLQEAKNVIAAIMQEDINRTYWSVMRGATGQQSQDSRPSDYMPDHFWSFAAASGDRNWIQVADQSFRIARTLQQNYSPNTGLIPDFVVAIGSTPAPAPANKFEGPNDGQYAWNACRLPWLLGAAYASSGDPRIAAILANLNAFIRTKTGGQPARIAAGYRLSGQPLDQWPAMAFIAPFGVSAMVGAQNQSWLNGLWDQITATSSDAEDYFGNNIKMMALITMSGNYWTPSP